MTEVIGINPEEAKILVESGRGFLIDVREDNEWAAGYIPGAVHAPLTRFMESDFPEAEGRTAIFHCRSGKRTTDYFDLFLKVGYDNVVHMEEGILGWAERGYEVKAD